MTIIQQQNLFLRDIYISTRTLKMATGNSDKSWRLGGGEKERQRTHHLRKVNTCQQYPPCFSDKVQKTDFSQGIVEHMSLRLGFDNLD